MANVEVTSAIYTDKIIKIFLNETMLKPLKHNPMTDIDRARKLIFDFIGV